MGIDHRHVCMMHHGFSGSAVALCKRRFQAYTIAMKVFLLLATAAVAYAQQPTTQHDNYYSRPRDAQVGERFVTQLQAGGVTATPEPRLDALGSRLATHSPEFKYRFLVFDGGKPSQDTAPNAAF